MENNKFIVHGGRIKSLNDGEIHYIRSCDVMKLYGVRQSECLLLAEHNDRSGISLGYDIMGIHLYPDATGNYNLAEQIHYDVGKRLEPRISKKIMREIVNLPFWEKVKFIFKKDSNGM